MTRVISLRALSALALVSLMSMTGCASLSQTQEGAIIGGAVGTVLGGVIGNQTGSTARGAIIGAAVGGAAGALIGRQMDQQAETLEDELPGATVERVGEGIQVTFDSGILFGFDSYSLRDAARENLSAVLRHADFCTHGNPHQRIRAEWVNYCQYAYYNGELFHSPPPFDKIPRKRAISAPRGGFFRLHDGTPGTLERR